MPTDGLFTRFISSGPTGPVPPLRNSLFLILCNVHSCLSSFGLKLLIRYCLAGAGLSSRFFSGGFRRFGCIDNIDIVALRFCLRDLCAALAAESRGLFNLCTAFRTVDKSFSGGELVLKLVDGL